MTHHFFKIYGSLERGVSLIITFLVMTIMLAIVLSITTILASEIRMIANSGNSISSLYAAQTGLEEVLYFTRKQVQSGTSSGFCNICNICNLAGCSNCAYTSLAQDKSNGCDVASCNNCQINYDSTFDGRSYTVRAKVTPNPLSPNMSILNIDSQGFYKDTSRSVKGKFTNP